MTYYRDVFVEYYKLDEPVVISTASGAQLQGIAEGTIALKVLRDGEYWPVTLTGVLHVPGLSGSLISVIQLQDCGITITTETTPGTGLVLSLNEKPIGTVVRHGRAYILSTEVPIEVAYSTQEVTPELLHRRLG